MSVRYKIWVNHTDEQNVMETSGEKCKWGTAQTLYHNKL